MRVARRLDRGQGLFIHILTLLVLRLQCYLLKYILRFMVMGAGILAALVRVLHDDHLHAAMILVIRIYVPL